MSSLKAFRIVRITRVLKVGNFDAFWVVTAEGGVVSWMVFPYVFFGRINEHFNVTRRDIFSDFSEAVVFFNSRMQDIFFRSQRLHLFPLSISFKVEIMKAGLDFFC